MPPKVIVSDDENCAVTVSVRDTDDGRQVVTVEITTGAKAAPVPAPSPFDQLEAIDAQIDARQSAAPAH